LAVPRAQNQLSVNGTYDYIIMETCEQVTTELPLPLCEARDLAITKFNC
jgi:hypothetical protein